MAQSKLTMLFQYTSAIAQPNAPIHRTGGWSESWYAPSDPGTTLLAAQGLSTGAGSGLSLLATRAALLPVGASIIGIRAQSVVPPGGAQTLAVNFPGTAGLNEDVPQLALLCSGLGAGVSNVRRFTLRGLPDTVMSQGEFSPTQGFASGLLAFFNVLGLWQLRGRDLSQAVNPILTISAAGVVTFAAAVTYNPLDFLRVLKTRDSSGNLRGGRFQITTIGPGSNNVTLLNWSFGATTGGTGRKDTAPIFAFMQPSKITPTRVIVRKVGRPFAGYRGRRSRRR